MQLQYGGQKKTSKKKNVQLIWFVLAQIVSQEHLWEVVVVGWKHQMWRVQYGGSIIAKASFENQMNLFLIANVNSKKSLKYFYNPSSSFYLHDHLYPVGYNMSWNEDFVKIWIIQQ